MSKKGEIHDVGEMLLIYNICYIVLGFALVGIAPFFNIQYSVGVTIVVILILLCNKLHLTPYWIEFFKKSQV